MTFEGISGKRVLVTGASGGIGVETACGFALNGSRVGIHYGQNQDSARKVQKRIQDEGGEGDLFQCDFSNPAVMPDLIEKFCQRFGGIDVLVNNAGSLIQPKNWAELDVETFEAAFRINAISPFLLSREAISRMKLQGLGGKIVNISSIGVKYAGSPSSLHYSASKAALETITRNLAKIGAPDEILVNAIRPGLTDTPFVDGLKTEARINLIPLKRMGEPGEIAQMVLYLASSAGDYITGQIIAVSGGD